MEVSIDRDFLGGLETLNENEDFHLEVNGTEMTESFKDSIESGFGFFVGVLIGSILIIALVGAIFASIISIVKIIAKWKMFNKANQPGWAAIIPFYNNWVLFETGDIEGWKSLLILIPLAGPIIFLVYSILAYINISKHFEKDSGFAIGLLFLPTIFLAILGFGSTKYKKSIK